MEINPDFTPVFVQLGFTLTDQARFGWEADRGATYQAALDCATKALAARSRLRRAYTIIGYVRTFQRRHDEAVAAGEKAIALSPGGTDAYHMAGMYHGYAHNFRTSRRSTRSRRNGLSPVAHNESLVDEARARFHLGEHIAARDIALRVLKEKPRWLTAHTTLVAALWNLGKVEEARSVAKELLRLTVSPSGTSRCANQAIAAGWSS